MNTLDVLVCIPPTQTANKDDPVTARSITKTLRSLDIHNLHDDVAAVIARPGFVNHVTAVTAHTLSLSISYTQAHMQSINSFYTTNTLHIHTPHVHRACRLWDELGACPWAERMRCPVDYNGKSDPNRNETVTHVPVRPFKTCTACQHRRTLAFRRSVWNTNVAKKIFASRPTLSVRVNVSSVTPIWCARTKLRCYRRVPKSRN
jgi:hypothetical protein